MFLKLLKDGDDETWDVHCVFEKDSPPDEVLAKYEASMQTNGCSFTARLACSCATSRICNFVVEL